MNFLRRTVLVHAAPLWAVLVLAGGASAAPGSLDREFGRGGIATPLFQPSSGVVALHVDGSAVFAAGQVNPEEYGGLLLSRYGLDGRRHPGFGTRAGPGAYRYEGAVGIVTRARESVTVGLAGFNGVPAAGQPPALIFARYRWDGSRDTRFGQGGHVTHRGLAPVRMQADRSGGLLVTAYRYDVRNDREPVLLRFLASGDRDLAFGDGGAVILQEGFMPSSLVVQSDGSILVAGLIYTAPPDQKLTPAVERFNARGDADLGFTPVRGPAERGLGADARLLMLSDRQERIVTAIARFGGTAVARYSRAGTPDTTFGAKGALTAPQTYATDMELDDGGRLLLTGPASGDGGYMRIGRLTARGQVDLTFGRRGFVRPVIRTHTVPPISALDGRGGLLVGGIAPLVDLNAPEQGAFARYEAGGTILVKVSGSGVLRRDTGTLRLSVRNTAGHSVPAELLVLRQRDGSLSRLGRAVQLTLPAHAQREVVVKLPRAAARALAARARPRIVVRLRSRDGFGNQKENEERVVVERRG